MSIVYQATPNPNSMKFLTGRQIADESVFFEEPLAATRSPLAQKLFNFAWVQAVMIGPDFVTITKQSWVDWSRLADPLCGLIAEHLERGEGILLPLPKEPHSHGHHHHEREHSLTSATETPTIVRIKEILDRDIRPSVARDGGDIIFDRFENGRVYLRLVGACSGCPSSTITLKQGVEARLREELPEVIEVLSI